MSNVERWYEERDRMEEAIRSDDYMYDSSYEHRLYEIKEKIREHEEEELRKLQERLGYREDEI